MNNNVEILIKLIVPAILLIFWALSNLFNRENTNAQARGTSPLGPRPPGYPPGPRREDRNRDRAVVTTTRPGASPIDNEVMIIRGEPNRPPTSGRPGSPSPPRSGQPQKRNNNRARNAQSPPQRRTEPERPRQMDLHDAKISTSVNQSISKSIHLRPLTESTPNAGDLGKVGDPSTVVDQAQSAMLFDLRAGLASQTRIREAFILNEILQRPVSLRGTRPGRR